jgi:hypothetical protein
MTATCNFFRNSTHYITLHNDIKLKEKSLEDNVYFTLRDIFLNIIDVNCVCYINTFNSILTNNIRYEDRNETFKYTNYLQDKNYVEHLSKFLCSLEKYDFNPETPSDEEKNEIDSTDFMTDNIIPFDVWWQDFENIKAQIKVRLFSL